MFAFLGEPHLTSAALADWVNSELELGGDEKYSADTMKQWLHKCGFMVCLGQTDFLFFINNFKGQGVQERSLHGWSRA